MPLWNGFGQSARRTVPRRRAGNWDGGRSQRPMGAPGMLRRCSIGNMEGERGGPGRRGCGFRHDGRVPRRAIGPRLQAGHRPGWMTRDVPDVVREASGDDGRNRPGGKAAGVMLRGEFVGCSPGMNQSAGLEEGQR